MLASMFGGASWLIVSAIAVTFGILGAILWWIGSTREKKNMEVLSTGSLWRAINPEGAARIKLIRTISGKNRLVE